MSYNDDSSPFLRNPVNYPDDYDPYQLPSLTHEIVYDEYIVNPKLAKYLTPEDKRSIKKLIQERMQMTAKKLFVATVFAERNGTLDSLKPGAMGGWESFIGKTQQEAIRKAMAAQHKWFRSPVDGEKYVILVGAITSKVAPRAEYDLVAL